MVQIDKLDLVLEENSNLDESTNQARYCMLSAIFFFFLDNSIITIGGREGGGCLNPLKGTSQCMRLLESIVLLITCYLA